MPNYQNKKNKRTAVVQYCISFKGMRPSDLDRLLEVKEQTRRKYIKYPETMRVEHLMKIIHGVPLSEGQLSDLLGGIEWQR